MIFINLMELLEQSSVAVSIRQSSWLYPFLEIIHITGIVILVGPAFMFDLRLLGLSSDLSLVGLKRHLLTWSMRGLWLVIPSGLLLFITNAEELAKDRLFWLKMILLALAGCNAFIFNKIIYKAGQGDKSFNSIAAKTAALFSIVLWIAVIACGRLLAY